VDRVTAAVATRRAELDQHRTTQAVGAVAAETPHTLVSRVRRFLRM